MKKDPTKSYQWIVISFGLLGVGVLMLYSIVCCVMYPTIAERKTLDENLYARFLEFYWYSFFMVIPLSALLCLVSVVYLIKVTSKDRALENKR